MSNLLQLIVNGLIIGSILALAGIGVSLPFGILRVVNFAQGDYLTYGAFAAFYLNVRLGYSIILAGIGSVLAIGVLGMLLEFGYWRPMRRRKAGAFAMLLSSFGLALVMRGVLFIVASAQPRAYNVDKFQSYSIFGIRISQSELIAVAVGLVAVIGLALLLSRTRLGRQLRALSDNRELASIAGVNTDRLVLFTWILAGALAALAGVLQALIQSSFDPNMGSYLLLPVFAAVILGGLGSAYGALIGGLITGLAMELPTWSAFGGGLDPKWQNVVAFGVLVVVLIVRPRGIFGEARATT